MKTKYFYNAFNILYDLVKESLGIFQKEELYRQLFQAIYVMSGDALYDNDSMLLGGEEARDKKEKKRRANNASPFTNLTYGVDGCNEPMFRIGYNTPLYTYTDERSAKAEP